VTIKIKAIENKWHTSGAGHNNKVAPTFELAKKNLD